MLDYHVGGDYEENQRDRVGQHLLCLCPFFQPLLLPQTQSCLDEHGASRLYIGVLFTNLYAASVVYVHMHAVVFAVPRHPMHSGL